MKNPSAGQLRHVIRFERKTTTADDSGNRQETWTKLRSVRGHIQPRRGDLRFLADKLTEIATHTITVRFVSFSISFATDRIVVDGRTFQIRHVINRDERSRWMDILVQEDTK